MKVCPKCNKKYDDETLNFCLDDGSVLEAAQEVSEDPPPTVMMPEPPPTSPGEPPTTQTTQQIWETAPRYQSPAQSGSKSWIWALGILGAIVVLCGGGFLGLLAIGIFVEDDESPPPAITEKDGPPKTRAPTDKRELEASDDFSDWDIKGNKFISAQRRSGELILTSVKGYYYVIMSRNFETENASVKLSVRNTTGTGSELGYGLIVHGDPWDVLADDYGFLVRSDTQQFRIVRHLKKEERTLINWTDFSGIRKGTGINELEVRVKGRDMEFYINDFYVATEKDVSKKRFFLQSQQKGEKRTAGIYTSGNIPIGFSKFEYRK